MSDVIPLNKQRSKHYAFTLNNWTDDDKVKLLAAFNAGGVDYLVFGEEIGTSGTPHLQGHVSFSQVTRGPKVLKVLGVQCHLSMAKNAQRSIDYCKKSGSYTEYGSSSSVPVARQRTDIEEFKLSVKGGITSLKVLREIHSGFLSRCERFAQAYVDDNRPSVPIRDHTPNDWQQCILDACSSEVDDSVIHFVIDHQGQGGKSWVCSYIERKIEKSQVLKAAKRDDMAYALDEDRLSLSFSEPAVVLVDVPRCYMEHLSYQFLEDLKDGRVFSPKYHSRTKRFCPPHVFVFCNEDPDESKLSGHRFNLTWISKKE